jgi:membrane associated rhomboid family serine protease
MKQAWITVAVFVAGTILGFLAIAGGFLAWAIATDFIDREGSTGMGVIFIEAPVGGLLIGLVAALITSRIQARRQRS